MLGCVGAVLAGFCWMIYDASRPGSPGGVARPGVLVAALGSKRPVLVEFYADWCGPCRVVGPQVEKLAGELRGRAEVIRFNVDVHGELARQYGVRGIPCFIAFKNGKEVSRQVGAIPPALMRSMIGM